MVQISPIHNVSVNKSNIENLFFMRKYFVISYGVFLMLYEISFMTEFVSQLHFIFVLWATLIVVIDCYTRSAWILVKFKWFPVAMSGAALITSVINCQISIIGVLKSWILLCIPLLIIYPYMFVTKNKIKELLQVTSGIVGVTFIASLLGIYMFIFRVNVNLEKYGINKTVGLLQSVNEDGSRAWVLFGIYSDSNHAAVYSIVSMILSVILIYAYKKRIIRKYKHCFVLFSILNIIIQVVFFPLANSRGAWVALIVTAIVVLLMESYFIIKKKKLKGCMDIILMSGVIIISLCVLIGIRNEVAQISDYIYNEKHQEKSEADIYQDINNELEANKTEETQYEVLHVQENENTFEKKEKINIRLYYWEEALKIFENRPIWGTSSVGYQHYAEKYNVGYYLKEGRCIHNSYIELLTGYGVCGTIIYFVFMCLALGCIVQCLSKDIEYKVMYYCVLFILGCVMIQGLFLSNLFINTTLMQYLMLLMLSYLVSSNVKYIKQSGNMSR